VRGRLLCYCVLVHVSEAKIRHCTLLVTTSKCLQYHVHRPRRLQTPHRCLDGKVGLLPAEDHCGAVNERTILEGSASKILSMSHPRLEFILPQTFSHLQACLKSQIPLYQQVLGLATRTPTTRSKIGLRHNQCTQPRNETSGVFGLQAYGKESQMVASRDGCQLASEFQGMNIYSKYCPVSDPKKADIELRSLLDRCGNREIQEGY
jgi:hypothetical protein